ncbi:beta-galactosidase [Pseudovibrio brasiliensis]|uniref:Beta-galactosidase n=1 Tax=Pseudovibrio brasiliensis TaxID=1898042 RepID=A0ABX8AP12_9HYPH|nr:beta-galactosidase [Pseudovibrio brasiliensis]QUS56308.1 beta-galactosidase [Pseudovibrio brasiliensis]
MLELGTCYYPEQWPEELWADDARRMVELGLTWVRVAEFSWALIEREEGVFDWAWLDKAVSILGEAGLQVVMCTPTAAPPRWLIDKYPEILPVDENGVTRKFGARRHYCFSSSIYLEYAARIAEAFAKRYGTNQYIKAWQIDNEYGDHDTIYSYSPAAKHAFNHWLKQQYGSIEALNEAWGTSFWGMHYSSFEQVELPNNLVEEPSPTHLLDFYRFSSDQVAKFNRTQVDVLRKHVGNAPITHNFMGHNTDYDHYAVGKDIDFASWDSYPMGALVNAPKDDDEKARLLRVGLPDQPAFNHDLYRHVGKGKAWVMEQQPGPVNWAKHNQSPQDGMIRLWTWLAYAHGIDVVCYFRWRQSKFAQEQFHTGLLLPNNEPDQAFWEVAQVAKECASLPETGARQKAQVALVLDYPSRWAAHTLPQGADYSSAKVAMDWYATFSQIGVDIDIIGPHSDLAGYKLIILPDMIIDDPEFASRLKEAEARVYLGPRTGSKTKHMHVAEPLPPGSFKAIIDLDVVRVESLPPYNQDRVLFDGHLGDVTNWRESLKSSETVLASFQSDYRDGQPALVGNAKCIYAAAHFDGAFQKKLAEYLVSWAGVEPHSGAQEGLRITQRGHLKFAFNFTNEVREIELGSSAKTFVGGEQIPPFGVVIWSDGPDG